MKEKMGYIMDFSWINTSWMAIWMVIVSTVGIYLALIVFTRMVSLSLFSEMYSFDFVITVSFGSVIASVILAKDPPLLQAIVGLGALYAFQIIVASLRGSSSIISKMVNNEP